MSTEHDPLCPHHPPDFTRIENPDRSITFTASVPRVLPANLLEPAEPQIESQIIRAITRGHTEDRDG